MCFVFTVQIDIARVFNSVLPQQTQPIDSFNGEKTITANYTAWYVQKTDQIFYVYGDAKSYFIEMDKMFIIELGNFQYVSNVNSGISE